MTKYSHQNTEYVAELGYMFYDNYKMFYKQLIKTKSIKNLETGIFEDLKAPIPSDSDSILKTSYGDYMTLPPEADRKIHQIKYL